MRCRYCFYADVADARAIPNYGMMSVETLENIVRKSMEAAEVSCMFGFQGGEPTLAGLDFYRTFIELEKRFNTRNLVTVHTLQTNGLLIDDEWAEFLAANKFLVGVSLDAPKAIHDEMRPDAAGRDTHNRVVKATRLLEKHGCAFNILSVVTRAMARHPEKAYRYYKERSFNHIQLIPCFDSLAAGHGANPHSLDAELYGRFLCRLFDLWYEDFIAGTYLSIRLFDNWVHMAAGHQPENCAAAGACQPYMLVEADGSVFPCDFYALDEYRIGNINTDAVEDIILSEKAYLFAKASRVPAPECESCEFFAMCRGGCRRDRETQEGGGLGLNVYCGAYKTFFAYTLPRFRHLASILFGPPKLPGLPPLSKLTFPRTPPPSSKTPGDSGSGET